MSQPVVEYHRPSIDDIDVRTDGDSAVITFSHPHAAEALSQAVIGVLIGVCLTVFGLVGLAVWPPRTEPGLLAFAVVAGIFGGISLFDYVRRLVWWVRYRDVPLVMIVSADGITASFPRAWGMRVRRWSRSRLRRVALTNQDSAKTVTIRIESGTVIQLKAANGRGVDLRPVFDRR